MMQLRYTFCSAMKWMQFTASAFYKCNLLFCQSCFAKYHCLSIITKDEEIEVIASLRQSNSPYKLYFDTSDL